jgi:hypothetical protein
MRSRIDFCWATWKVRTSPSRTAGRKGGSSGSPTSRRELDRLKVDVTVSVVRRPWQRKMRPERLPSSWWPLTIRWGAGSSAASRARARTSRDRPQCMHDLVGKQLEVLKEIVPKPSRVAVLWHSSGQSEGAGFSPAPAGVVTVERWLSAIPASGSGPGRQRRPPRSRPRRPASRARAQRRRRPGAASTKRCSTGFARTAALARLRDAEAAYERARMWRLPPESRRPRDGSTAVGERRRTSP